MKGKKMEEIQQAKNSKTYSFDKVRLDLFGDALCKLMGNNKKIMILNYILSKKDTNNKITRSITEISDILEISYRTVQSALIVLKNEKMIDYKPGVIMVNPYFINRRKSNTPAYYALLREYDEFNPKNEDVLKLGQRDGCALLDASQ